MKLAGDKNRYQVIMVIFVFVLWLNCTMMDFSLPFLENTPLVSFYDKEKNETLVEPMSYEICDWDKSNYTIVETYHYSWVIDLDIICDQFRVSLLGTLVSLGFLSGALTYSLINKFLGQRLLFFISLGCFIVIVILAIFVNYYEFYCVTCYLLALLCNLMEYATMVFNTEITDLDKVAISNAVINSGLAFGGVFYISLYYAIGNWKYIFAVSIGICVALGIFMFIFLLDSPKAAIDKKDLAKFLKIMRFVAKCNGRLEIFNKEIEKDEYQLILKALLGEIVLDPNPNTESNQIMTSTPKTEINEPNPNTESNQIMPSTPKAEINEPMIQSPQITEQKNINDVKMDSEVKHPSSDIQKYSKEIHREQAIEKSPQVEINKANTGMDQNKEKKKRYTPLVLLKYASVRYTFLLLCFLWFCTSALYSGLTFGLKSLPGSIYVNGILVYCAEIPAYFSSGFLMNSKLGRKKSLMISTAGFSLLWILLVILFHYDTASVVLFVFTRFFVMSSFCIYYTFCIESYPVSVSSMAYGINGSFNSLGGAVAPFIVEYIERRLLYGIYGGIGVLCASLMFFLKETRGVIRPDEIKELTIENKAKELANIPIVIV